MPTSAPSDTGREATISKERTNVRLRSRGARRLALAAVAFSLIPASARAVTVDPANRDSVVAAYTAVAVEGNRVDPGWTGNAETCTPGTESAASQNAALEAVNFVRGMNYLPPVVLDAELSRRALSAALIMAANDDLSHNPTPAWRCWTQEGADAAGTSNLAIGLRTATSTVIAYINDDGLTNRAVGHRRWLLYPPLGTIGSGTTTNTNAITAIGTPSQGRANVLTVSWPPSGQVPWPLIFDRFSMSSALYPNADYRQAQVTVTANGTPLPVTINPIENGYGDNTIVTEVAIPDALRSARPETTFVMTVSNVINPATNTPMTLTSQTHAFDFDTPELVNLTAVGNQGEIHWAAAEHGVPITGFTVTYTPSAGTGAPQTFTLPPSARSFTPPSLGANNVLYTVDLVAHSRLGDITERTYFVANRAATTTRPPQTTTKPPATTSRPRLIALGPPRIVRVERARAVQLKLNTSATVRATVYRRHPRLRRFVAYRVLKPRKLAAGKRRMMIGVLSKGTYRVVTTGRRPGWVTAKRTTDFAVR